MYLPVLGLLSLLQLASVRCQTSADDAALYAEIFGTPDPNALPPSTDLPPAPVTERTTSTTPAPRIDLDPVTPVAQDAEDKSCLLDDNQAGECVPYYLCNNNNTIINDGEGIIDIRVRDGVCKSYLDTCCLPPDRRPSDNPIKPTPSPNKEVREGCGWRNPNGVGFRITGDNDNEAKFGEFPWMVAILRLEPVDENDTKGQALNVYVGGGSLILPNVVLTAAHYVTDKKRNWRVRAGEWDTQTKAEIYPYQDRKVQAIEAHQDFNSGNLFYDIALLFLESPVELAPNVGLVCLPPPRQRTPAGTRCFASGWGKDQFGKEGRYQVILKSVEVPVVDRNVCQDKLRKTRLGRHFMLHSSFMCAGGEKGKDTCKGDGGSPLVCPYEFENGRYIQSGIVAWGVGCGEDGTPGVYVDVSNLRDWIDDRVIKHGHQPDEYTLQ